VREHVSVAGGTRMSGCDSCGNQVSRRRNASSGCFVRGEIGITRRSAVSGGGWSLVPRLRSRFCLCGGFGRL
jgi:hypothetical protein